MTLVYLGKMGYIKWLFLYKGLDPAGLFFEDSDKLLHLDKSDAKFVDIIHSNAGKNYN